MALSVVAAAATVAGGAFVVMHVKHRIIWLKSFLAFGAGFLLAAGILAMVPEAFRALNEGAALLILGGYLLTHLFEHTLVPHLHFGEETHSDTVALGGDSFAATVLGLFVHSLFDGVAIGSGFVMDSRLGWLLFLAVALHKMPDGFTLASVALASNQTRRVALGGVMSLAAATILGTAIVSFVAGWAAPALAMSAGVAIYVAATDLMPEVNREHGIRWSLLSFAGVLAFYLTEQVLHLFHSP